MKGLGSHILAIGQICSPGVTGLHGGVTWLHTQYEIESENAFKLELDATDLVCSYKGNKVRLKKKKMEQKLAQPRRA